MAKKDNLEQMREEALRRQDNLASDIDELIDRLNPANAVQRWKNELLGSVKDFSAAGDGESTGATSPAVIAGGVIGTLALVGGIVAIAAASRGNETKKAQRASLKARKDFVKQAKKTRKQAKKAAGDVDLAIANAREAVAEFLQQAAKR